jgi:hypothetical protein
MIDAIEAKTSVSDVVGDVVLAGEHAAPYRGYLR